MGFVPFTFVDFIDIILVAVIMYWIYRMTKGTNAPYILSGIIAIYLLWVVVRTLNMELLSTILGQLISVGAIALIIVFQPELRLFCTFFAFLYFICRQAFLCCIFCFSIIFRQFIGYMHFHIFCLSVVLPVLFFFQSL